MFHACKRITQNDNTGQIQPFSIGKYMYFRDPLDMNMHQLQSLRINNELPI